MGLFVPSSVLSIAYLIAAVLFVKSLGGLSTQESARKGNAYGVLGMVLAIVATAAQATLPGVGIHGAALVVGGGIGALLASRVAMTAMPELVAILHSFVGLAAVLVGVSSHLHPGQPMAGSERAVHLVEIWLGVAIGAVTFTGSVIAWAKLRGTMSGRPLLLPGRHLLNGLVVVALVGGVVPYLLLPGEVGTWLLLGNAVLAGLIGVHLVVAIGGADMPVVVSLLNSYSGWAAAAAGFMLGNDLLIVTGALVGSSGAILSTIMCRAMNRSIWNVVFGGFGTDGGAPAAPSSAPTGTIREIKGDEVAAIARAAKEIIIVPGYGMAVARAQHSVHDFARLLRERGVNVRYAIHPVAGRLPGHMNVLLAEAGVPYDIVLEMEEINQDFVKADLVLVIGANDIVNPAAETDAASPIYGMPVLKVWDAKMVVVSKRGMSAGYAGVDNPLFTHERARMLFGDANKTMQALVGVLRES